MLQLPIHLLIDIWVVFTSRLSRTQLLRIFSYRHSVEGDMWSDRSTRRGSAPPPRLSISVKDTGVHTIAQPVKGIVISLLPAQGPPACSLAPFQTILYTTSYLLLLNSFNDFPFLLRKTHNSHLRSVIRCSWSPLHAPWTSAVPRFLLPSEPPIHFLLFPGWLLFLIQTTPTPSVAQASLL